MIAVVFIHSVKKIPNIYFILLAFYSKFHQTKIYHQKKLCVGSDTYVYECKQKIRAYYFYFPYNVSSTI
jgi:hypothetical protein